MPWELSENGELFSIWNSKQVAIVAGSKPLLPFHYYMIIILELTSFEDAATIGLCDMPHVFTSFFIK